MSLSIFDPSQNMYVKQIGISQYNDDRLRRESLKKKKEDVEKEEEIKKKLIVEKIIKTQIENYIAKTEVNKQRISIVK